MSGPLRWRTLHSRRMLRPHSLRAALAVAAGRDPPGIAGPATRPPPPRVRGRAGRLPLRRLPAGL